MKDGDIDYSEYTVHQLHEALDHIRRDTYPNNYANILTALKALEDSAVETSSPPTPIQPPPQAQPPRPMSLERLGGILALSVLFLAYGAFALLRGDFYVPTRGGGQHLRGDEAIAFFIVVVAAVIANTTKLISWLQNPSEDAPWYRFGTILARAAIFGYIAYLLSGLFGSRP